MEQDDLRQIGEKTLRTKWQDTLTQQGGAADLALDPGSTALVTGVAGFIGAKVAEFLLNQGVHVRGLDSLNDYYDVRLKRHRLDRLQEHCEFSFVESNIEELDQLRPMFEEGDLVAVFNLAARAGVRNSITNPFIYLSTNSFGTLNLLEAMKEYDVRKLVLASTSSLYAGAAMPFSEDFVTDSPISPYAASKKSAEVLAYTYHYLFGIDVSVLRYFTVYGPAGRPDMSIFRFIKWIDEGRPIQLAGDGSQKRDFTYIDDIARGTILAAKPVGYRIVNLGCGRTPTSLTKVISQIESLLGRKASIERLPFHQADVMETHAKIERASDLFGWTPEVEIDEGLRRTVEWHVNNREWLARISV